MPTEKSWQNLKVWISHLQLSPLYRLWVSFSSLLAYGILSGKATEKYSLHQSPLPTLQAQILIRKKSSQTLTMQQDSHLSLLRRCQDWPLGMLKVLWELESPNAVDKYRSLQQLYFNTVWNNLKITPYFKLLNSNYFGITVIYVEAQCQYRAFRSY